LLGKISKAAAAVGPLHQFIYLLAAPPAHHLNTPKWFMDFNWLHIVMQIILQHYIETDLSVTKKVATGIVLFFIFLNIVISRSYIDIDSKGFGLSRLKVCVGRV